jgi:hypothetical protein
MTRFDPFVGLPRPYPAPPASLAAPPPNTPRLAAVSNAPGIEPAPAVATASPLRVVGTPAAPPASLLAQVDAGLRAGLDGRRLREHVVAATVAEELGPGVPTAVVRRTTAVVLADPELRAQLELAIATSRKRSATPRA